MRASSPRQVIIPLRHKAVVVGYLFLALGVMVANIVWPGTFTFFVSLGVFFVVLMVLRMILGLRTSPIPLVDIRKSKTWVFDGSLGFGKGKLKYQVYRAVEIGSREWKFLEKLQREGSWKLLSSRQMAYIPSRYGSPREFRSAPSGHRYVLFEYGSDSAKTVLNLEKLVKFGLS